MIALVQVLACFAGVFAFAFLTAGVLGMMDFGDEAAPHRQLQNPDAPRFLRLPEFCVVVVDLILCGVLSLIHGVTMNWERRPAERRLLLAGIACSVLCLFLVAVVLGISGGN